MTGINNLGITITKDALFSEKKLKKTYITANGLKNLITASFTCYSRLVVSQILTKISHANRLQLIIKNLPTAFNTSYQTISNAFRNKISARKKLRETISNSHNLRCQYVSDLALALELNEDYTKVKDIKQLITIEYQRRLHSTIK